MKKSRFIFLFFLFSCKSILFSQVSYKSIDTKEYVISYPENWSIKSKDIQISKELTCLLYIKHEKESENDNFFGYETLLKSDFGTSTLDEIGDQMINVDKILYKNDKLNFSKKIGKNYLEYNYEHLSQLTKEKILLCRRLYQKNNFGYVLEFAITENSDKKYELIKQKILDSFQIKN